MELDGVWRDIAFAQRSCRRQPGFALTALATLTLGIGACTAIFSVVNAVLLRPAPYPDPDRIVLVGTNTGASAPKLAASAQATDVFRELSAYRGGRVNVTTTHESRHGLAHSRCPMRKRTSTSSPSSAQPWCRAADSPPMTIAHMRGVSSS